MTERGAVAAHFDLSPYLIQLHYLKFQMNDRWPRQPSRHLACGFGADRLLICEGPTLILFAVQIHIKVLIRKQAV